MGWQEIHHFFFCIWDKVKKGHSAIKHIDGVVVIGNVAVDRNSRSRIFDT